MTPLAKHSPSFLGAKVLNQLSLSAWLPSAALVLLVAFVLELGARVGSGVSPCAASTGAIDSIGDTSFGGVVLLFLVVVVTRW